MLQLSAYLVNKPVLSLRTGGAVALVIAPIFNPHSLKIEAFYCQDNLSSRQLILLCQDIRELSAQGFIADDHDVLTPAEDLVRLHDILEMNFELLHMPVETVSKAKIGKVGDYAVETTTMYVQKLYVTQSIWKSLSTGSLSIDRSQIVEVTNRRIIIQDLLRGVPSAAPVAIA